ncbi:MAG: hypothetical protein EBZ48_11055, partial [Proteobacteria bacterium]|nr:hypothetical protein [Pseudomonadota bacterium]
EVETENIPAFIAVRERLIIATKARFAGLISATLLRHVSTPTTLADLWLWDSMANAQAGFAGFKKLPEAGDLKQLVKSILYSGHFERLSGP